MTSANLPSSAPSPVAAQAVGPVVLAVWREEVTPESVEEVAQLLHCTAIDHPRGIAFVTIAQFQAPIPSAPIRARIVEIYRELGSQLHGVAQVVEGSGFWASAALCFIAGLGLLHRHDHPMKVFGNVDDAAQWVAALGVPGAPNAAFILEQIAHRVAIADALHRRPHAPDRRSSGDVPVFGV